MVDMLYRHHEELVKFAETTVSPTDEHFTQQTRQRYFAPYYAQSDFMMVPLQNAPIFASLVDMHADSKVFLECMAPNIAFWMTMEQFRSPEARLGLSSDQRRDNVSELLLEPASN